MESKTEECLEAKVIQGVIISTFHHDVLDSDFQLISLNH